MSSPVIISSGTTPIIVPGGSDHPGLSGRSTADQHPTSAITGLDAALAAKAPLASPALTGVPTAPTAAADTSTTQIATTAFAKAEADAAQAASQPLDSDLTAIAALTTTAFGRGLLTAESGTAVTGLNASQLLGATWAAPGAIGGTTPAAVACTTLTASYGITLTGSIVANTADGSDNSLVSICGGGAGAQGRGAFAYASGNEYAAAGYKGIFEFTSGFDAGFSNADDGGIYFTTAGVRQLSIRRTGSATFASSVSCASLTSTGLITGLGTYAQIYLSDGVTTHAIPSGTSYTLINTFNTAQGVNGPSNDATADKANNKITLTRAGTYKIDFSINVSCGTNNVVTRVVVFAGGVEQPAIHAATKLATSGDPYNLAGNGMITVAANTDIDLRVRHDNGGSVTYTPVYMTFNAHKIG